MDTCTVETGLLRKKPCGHAAVTQCLNCERPLCSHHAVAQVNEAGRKSGKFLCKECHAAWREIEKHQAPVVASKPAEKPAPAPAAGTPAQAKAPAAKPAPAKETPAKPAEAKEAPAKPAEEKGAPAKPADSGMIEFTPTKKP